MSDAEKHAAHIVADADADGARNPAAGIDAARFADRPLRFAPFGAVLGTLCGPVPNIVSIEILLDAQRNQTILIG